MTPLLSIIIVSWNTRDYLRRCLASIEKALPESPALEVFVVDNASSDGSAAMVSGDFPFVHLIQNSHNAHFARANNQALALAQGEFVFFLNPDAELQGPPQALELLCRELQNRPQAGIVAPRLLNSDLSHQLSVINYHTLDNLVRDNAPDIWPLNLRRRLPDRTSRAARQPIAVPTAIGAAMMMRRELALKVGGFDEGYGMFFEDFDLCWKVRREGYKIIYHPGVRVVHHANQSARQLKLWREAQTHRAQSRFIKKRLGHFHYLGYRLLAPTFNLGMALVLLYLLPIKPELLPLFKRSLVLGMASGGMLTKKLPGGLPENPPGS